MNATEFFLQSFLCLSNKHFLLLFTMILRKHLHWGKLVKSKFNGLHWRPTKTMPYCHWFHVNRALGKKKSRRVEIQQRQPKWDGMKFFVRSIWFDKIQCGESPLDGQKRKTPKKKSLTSSRSRIYLPTTFFSFFLSYFSCLPNNLRLYSAKIEKF